MNRAIITRITMNQKPLLIYTLLNEDRQWLDLDVQREDQLSLVNNIYVGKVSNIVKNINAAFIQIGKDKKCFLPLDDRDMDSIVYTTKPSKSPKLCIGDELLVQITKDAVKTKDAVASTKLVLHGKYCFLSTSNTKHGVSQKLNATKREELLTKLNNWLLEEPHSYPFGLVFRTNSAEAEEEALREDVKSLIRQYERLMEEAKHKKLYSLAYSFDSFAIACTKKIDFAKIDSLVTDQADIYQELCQYFPEKAEKFNLYTDKAISLQTLYGFQSNLDELTSRKVWLKSGGNIIIESLETLTAIDVNSSKAQDKKSDFMLRLNKEAAHEIARQLRLRSISGMIIVDFINMNSEEEKAELISYLKDEIKLDHTPCNFIDITKLGLVELTRKKSKRSLHETLSQ